MDTEGVVRLGMPGDRVPKAKEYQKFLTTYSLLWRPIGENLGLKSAVLSLIEAENPMKPRECLRVTLERWLQLDVNATWSTLELAITNANRTKNGLDPLDAMPPETVATVQGAVATPSSNTAASNSQIHSAVLKRKPIMHELTKIVIPKIMNEWELIAEAFEYDDPIITAIKDKERGDPRKCCREFFKDWLQTNHGVKAGPKVWSTLLAILEDIDEISADIIGEITEKVKQLKS